MRAAYAAAGIAAELAPFFPRLAARSRRAHLVIARAGASTVAELAVAGRPAILVPLPGAIDDHQTANAARLADAGGAWVMPQPAFTADGARAPTRRRCWPTRRAATRGRARGQRWPHATPQRELADLVEQCMLCRRAPP